MGDCFAWTGESITSFQVGYVYEKTALIRDEPERLSFQYGMTAYTTIGD